MNNRNNDMLVEYYAGHRDELIKFIAARLGSVPDAEDLLHDVFLQLLTTENIISTVTLSGLVYTMIRNRITDRFRRMAIYREYENASKLEHSATFNANGTAIYSPAESRLAMRDITEHIEHGLAGIPENCREIYRMHIYAGMKTGEISRQTGDNYRSVEHRPGKARIYIRTYLSQCV